MACDSTRMQFDFPTGKLQSAGIAAKQLNENLAVSACMVVMKQMGGARVTRAAVRRACRESSASDNCDVVYSGGSDKRNEAHTS